VLVLAAADNVAQQKDFAARIGATFAVIPGSTHRSVLGKIEYATVLADHVRSSLESHVARQ